MQSHACQLSRARLQGSTHGHIGTYLPTVTDAVSPFHAPASVRPCMSFPQEPPDRSHRSSAPVTAPASELHPSFSSPSHSPCAYRVVSLSQEIGRFSGATWQCDGVSKVRNSLRTTRLSKYHTVSLTRSSAKTRIYEDFEDRASLAT